MDADEERTLDERLEDGFALLADDDPDDVYNRECARLNLPFAVRRAGVRFLQELLT